MAETSLSGLPVPLGMARGTFATQRGLVCIVLPMTCRTLLGGFLEQDAGMTALALGLRMLAQQRERRCVMIEFGRFFPASLGMATGTVPAQGLLVLVVFPVAGVAVLTQSVLVKIARVAILAGNTSVLSAQRVLRICIVIKASGFPLLGSVATIAALTKVSAVPLQVVVFAVTGHACKRSSLVNSALVAIGTPGIHMFASQRKTRDVMVKTSILPSGLGVAVRTLCA